LHQLVRRSNHSARQVTRARLLLRAAADATDEQSVASLKTGFATVERTPKRLVEESLGCLNERPRRGAERKLTGQQEAHLVAGACRTPPEGPARSTRRLLADKVVELKCAAASCRETVGQVRKQTN